jgi:hypothetical protein
LILRIIFQPLGKGGSLVLPAILHDLPENYMKSLPKFTGEGDLTTT